MTTQQTQHWLLTSVLSMLLMYVIFIRPQKLELLHQRERFKQLTTNLQNDRALIAQQKTISAQINELKLKTPSSAYKKTREKMTLLSELANENHLDSFQMNTDETNKPRLSAKSHYHSIIAFLKQCHDAHLALLIEQYTLEAIPGSHQLNLNLSFSKVTDEKSQK